MKTIYGTFDGQGLTRYTKADSLEKLGLLFLQKTLKEEGLKMNKEGIITYLEGWCEWSEETEDPCTEPELMIDQAANTLVYSNIHFMNMDTRAQISNADREIVFKTIYDKLNKPFQK